MGRGCVLDIKQTKGLQPETGREVRGGNSGRRLCTAEATDQLFSLQLFLAPIFPPTPGHCHGPHCRAWRNDRQAGMGTHAWSVATGLWGCSCGHPSQGGSREASPQPHSQETASSGRSQITDLSCSSPRIQRPQHGWQKADLTEACQLSHTEKRAMV